MSSPRPAFTLIEIIAALAVMGLAAGLISATLTRHQRLYRAATETMDVHRGVRDGAAVLAEEIRGASANDTIRLMSDSAIELFTALGSSVVCGSVSPTDVALAPVTANDVSLTSWLAVPDTGDFALLYHAVSSTPGAWERFRIRAVASRAASSACSGSAFAAGGGSAYVISLSPAPSVVTSGEAVRFVRRGRYSLYKSSDGRWYLGYRRCNAIGASVCGAIQPVSGYYQPYSSDTARTGLLYRYFDAAGQSLGVSASPLSVRKIGIVTRAVSPNAVTIDGLLKTARDSASISVSLRNRP